MLKITTWLTAIIFFASNFVAAPQSYAAAMVYAQAEVRVSPNFQLEIPAELGTVDRFHLGNGPTLIHVQTAHGNYEAQKNIQTILHHLKTAYDINTVFVEGTAFKLEPEILRIFPDDSALTKSIADHLAKQALIKAPELFLIDEPQAEGYGIETLSTYLANRDAFRTVLKAREESSEFVQGMDSQIRYLSGHFLNVQLRQFLKQLAAHDEGFLSLPDWLELLRAQAKEQLRLDLTDPALQIDWPQLLRIFKLREFESKIDMTEFPVERDRFLADVRRLVIRADRRPVVDEVESLLSMGLTQHHLPEPQTGNLIESLVALLPPNFNYEAYPNVKFFVGHLLLQSELKADRLMAETERLIGRLSDTLAVSPEEKSLVRLLTDYRLLQKLFRLELTPAEYDAIMLNGGEGSAIRPSAVAARFLSLNADKRVREARFDSLDRLDALFKKAMEFYRLVKKRDAEMTENIARRMQELELEKAVVITGGFHQEPFREFFEDSGYSYAVVSPKIGLGEAEDGQKAYVAAVLQDASNIFTRSTMETASLAHGLAQRKQLFDNLRWLYGAEVGTILSVIAPLLPDRPGLAAQLNASAHASTAAGDPIYRVRPRQTATGETVVDVVLYPEALGETSARERMTVPVPSVDAPHRSELRAGEVASNYAWPIEAADAGAIVKAIDAELEFVRVLGESERGEVYLVKDAAGGEKALKVPIGYKVRTGYGFREAEEINRILTENIVHLLEKDQVLGAAMESTGYVPKIERLYRFNAMFGNERVRAAAMLMEYVDGQPVSEALAKPADFDAKNFSRRFAEFVLELGRQKLTVGIFGRRVKHFKPDSFRITPSGELKLVDMGTLVAPEPTHMGIIPENIEAAHDVVYGTMRVSIIRGIVQMFKRANAASAVGYDLQRIEQEIDDGVSEVLPARSELRAGYGDRFDFEKDKTREVVGGRLEKVEERRRRNEPDFDRDAFVDQVAGQTNRYIRELSRLNFSALRQAAIDRLRNEDQRRRQGYGRFSAFAYKTLTDMLQTLTARETSLDRSAQSYRNVSWSQKQEALVRELLAEARAYHEMDFRFYQKKRSELRVDEAAAKGTARALREKAQRLTAEMAKAREHYTLASFGVRRLEEPSIWHLLAAVSLPAIFLLGRALQMIAWPVWIDVVMSAVGLGLSGLWYLTGTILQRRVGRRMAELNKERKRVREEIMALYDSRLVSRPGDATAALNVRAHQQVENFSERNADFRDRVVAVYNRTPVPGIYFPVGEREAFHLEVEMLTLELEELILDAAEFLESEGEPPFRAGDLLRSGEGNFAFAMERYHTLVSRSTDLYPDFADVHPQAYGASRQARSELRMKYDTPDKRYFVGQSKVRLMGGYYLQKPEGAIYRDGEGEKKTLELESGDRNAAQMLKTSARKWKQIARAAGDRQMQARIETFESTTTVIGKDMHTYFYFSDLETKFAEPSRLSLRRRAIYISKKLLDYLEPDNELHQVIVALYLNRAQYVIDLFHDLHEEGYTAQVRHDRIRAEVAKEDFKDKSVLFEGITDKQIDAVLSPLVIEDQVTAEEDARRVLAEEPGIVAYADGLEAAIQKVRRGAEDYANHADLLTRENFGNAAHKLEVWGVAYDSMGHSKKAEHFYRRARRMLHHAQRTDSGSMILPYRIQEEIVYLLLRAGLIEEFFVEFKRLMSAKGFPKRVVPTPPAALQSQLEEFWQDWLPAWTQTAIPNILYTLHVYASLYEGQPKEQRIHDIRRAVVEISENYLRKRALAASRETTTFDTVMRGNESPRLGRFRLPLSNSFRNIYFRWERTRAENHVSVRIEGNARTSKSDAEVSVGSLSLELRGEKAAVSTNDVDLTARGEDRYIGLTRTFLILAMRLAKANGAEVLELHVPAETRIPREFENMGLQKVRDGLWQYDDLQGTVLEDFPDIRLDQKWKFRWDPKKERSELRAERSELPPGTRFNPWYQWRKWFLTNKGEVRAAMIASRIGEETTERIIERTARLAFFTQWIPALREILLDEARLAHEAGDIAQQRRLLYNAQSYTTQKIGRSHEVEGAHRGIYKKGRVAEYEEAGRVPPEIEEITHPSYPGYLFLPPHRDPGQKVPVVILLHGLTHTHEQAELDPIEMEMIDRGFAVFRLSFPGHGDHDTPLEGPEHLVRFVEAAIGFLQGRPEIEAQNIAMFGYSFGGYAALRALANSDFVAKNVRATATINAPARATFTSSRNIWHMDAYAGNVLGMEPGGADISGRLRRHLRLMVELNKYGFSIDDFSRLKAKEHPTLLFFGDKDWITHQTDRDLMTQFASETGSPLVMLEGEGHHPAPEAVLRVAREAADHFQASFSQRSELRTEAKNTDVLRLRTEKMGKGMATVKRPELLNFYLAFDAYYGDDLKGKRGLEIGSVKGADQLQAALKARGAEMDEITRLDSEGESRMGEALYDELLGRSNMVLEESEQYDFVYFDGEAVREGGMMPGDERNGTTAFSVRYGALRDLIKDDGVLFVTVPEGGAAEGKQSAWLRYMGFEQIKVIGNLPGQLLLAFRKGTPSDSEMTQDFLKHVINHRMQAKLKSAREANLRPGHELLHIAVREYFPGGVEGKKAVHVGDREESAALNLDFRKRGMTIDSIPAVDPLGSSYNPFALADALLEYKDELDLIYMDGMEVKRSGLMLGVQQNRVASFSTFYATAHNALREGGVLITDIPVREIDDNKQFAWLNYMGFEKIRTATDRRRRRAYVYRKGPRGTTDPTKRDFARVDGAYAQHIASESDEQRAAWEKGAAALMRVSTEGKLAKQAGFFYFLGNFVYKHALIQYAMGRYPGIHEKSLHDFINAADPSVRELWLGHHKLYNSFTELAKGAGDFDPNAFYATRDTRKYLMFLMIGALYTEGHESAIKALLHPSFDGLDYEPEGTSMEPIFEPHTGPPMRRRQLLAVGTLLDAHPKARAKLGEILFEGNRLSPDQLMAITTASKGQREYATSATPHKFPFIIDERYATWGDSILDMVVLSLLVDMWRADDVPDEWKQYDVFRHLHGIIASNRLLASVMMAALADVHSQLVTEGEDYHSTLFEALVAHVYKAAGGENGAGLEQTKKFVVHMLNRHLGNGRDERVVKRFLRQYMLSTKQEDAAPAGPDPAEHRYLLGPTTEGGKAGLNIERADEWFQTAVDVSTAIDVSYELQHDPRQRLKILRKAMGHLGKAEKFALKSAEAPKKGKKRTRARKALDDITEQTGIGINKPGEPEQRSKYAGVMAKILSAQGTNYLRQANVEVELGNLRKAEDLYERAIKKQEAALTYTADDRIATAQKTSAHAALGNAYRLGGDAAAEVLDWWDAHRYYRLAILQHEQARELDPENPVHARESKATRARLGWSFLFEAIQLYYSDDVPVDVLVERLLDTEAADDFLRSFEDEKDRSELRATASADNVHDITIDRDVVEQWVGRFRWHVAEQKGQTKIVHPYPFSIGTLAEFALGLDKLLDFPVMKRLGGRIFMSGLNVDTQNPNPSERLVRGSFAGIPQVLKEARLLRVKSKKFARYDGQGNFDLAADMVIPFVGAIHREDGTELTEEEMASVGLEWVRDSENAYVHLPLLQTAVKPTRQGTVLMPKNKIKMIVNDGKMKILATAQDYEAFIGEEMGQAADAALAEIKEQTRSGVAGVSKTEFGDRLIPGLEMYDEVYRALYMIALFNFARQLGHKLAFEVIALQYKGIGGKYTMHTAPLADVIAGTAAPQLVLADAGHEQVDGTGVSVVQDPRLEGKSGVFLTSYQHSNVAIGGSSLEEEAAVRHDKLLLENGAYLSAITIAAEEILSREDLSRLGVSEKLEPLYASVRVIVDDTRSLSDIMVGGMQNYLVDEIDPDLDKARDNYLSDLSEMLALNIAAVLKSHLTIKYVDMATHVKSGFTRNVSPAGLLKDTGDLVPITIPQDALILIRSLFTGLFVVAEATGLKREDYRKGPHFKTVIETLIKSLGGSEAQIAAALDKAEGLRQELVATESGYKTKRLLSALMRTAFDQWADVQGISTRETEWIFQGKLELVDDMLDIAEPRFGLLFKGRPEIAGLEVNNLADVHKPSEGFTRVLSNGDFGDIAALFGRKGQDIGFITENIGILRTQLGGDDLRYVAGSAVRGIQADDFVTLIHTILVPDVSDISAEELPAYKKISRAVILDHIAMFIAMFLESRAGQAGDEAARALLEEWYGRIALSEPEMQRLHGLFSRSAAALRHVADNEFAIAQDFSPKFALFVDPDSVYNEMAVEFTDSDRDFFGRLFGYLGRRYDEDGHAFVLPRKAAAIAGTDRSELREVEVTDETLFAALNSGDQQKFKALTRQAERDGFRWALIPAEDSPEKWQKAAGDTKVWNYEEHEKLFHYLTAEIHFASKQVVREAQQVVDASIVAAATGGGGLVFMREVASDKKAEVEVVSVPVRRNVVPEIYFMMGDYYPLGSRFGRTSRYGIPNIARIAGLGVRSERLHGGSYSTVERKFYPDGRVLIEKRANTAKDKGKLRREAEFIRRLQSEGDKRGEWFPKLLRIHDDGEDTVVEMEDIPWPNLTRVIEHSVLSPELSLANRTPFEMAVDIYRNLLPDLYLKKVADTPEDFVDQKHFEKLDERWAEAARDSEVARRLLAAPYLEIRKRKVNRYNGMTSPLQKQYRPNLPTTKRVLELLSSLHPMRFVPPYLSEQMGDLHFGNILIDRFHYAITGEISRMKFVDPKWMAEGNDPLYDFAKLLHNQEGRYDLALNHSHAYHFEIELPGTEGGAAVLSEYHDLSDANTANMLSNIKEFSAAFRVFMRDDTVKDELFPFEVNGFWKDRLLFTHATLLAGLLPYHVVGDEREWKMSVIYEQAVQAVYEVVHRFFEMGILDSTPELRDIWSKIETTRFDETSFSQAIEELETYLADRSELRTKRVAVIGASSFVGSEIDKAARKVYANVSGTAYSRVGDVFAALDVKDEAAVRRFIAEFRPDVIVYAAGEPTAEGAEADRAKAYALNVTAVETVRRYFDGPLIYLSSNYVFEGGNAPYGADAEPRPLNYYGETKAAGEKLVLEHPKGAVVRLGIGYGEAAIQKNFIKQVVDFLDSDDESASLVLDNEQVRHPTSVRDVASLTLDIIQGNKTGIHQINGAESLTKYEWARLIAEVYYEIYPNRAKETDKIGMAQVKADSPGIGKPRNAHMINSRVPTPLVDAVRAIIPKLSVHDTDRSELRAEGPRRSPVVTVSPEALITLKKFREFLMSRLLVQTLGPEGARDLLSQVLGKKVFAVTAGIFPERVESAIEKAGGKYMAAVNYPERVQADHPGLAESGTGRVILDPDWMQALLDSPRALYVFLEALDEFHAQSQSSEPFVAVMANPALYAEIRRRLTNRNAEIGLGMVKTMALRRSGGLLSRLDKLIEVVSYEGSVAEAMNSYIKAHDYAVAAFLADDVQYLSDIIGSANFVLNPDEVHETDRQAAALMIPEILKAAELIRGVSDPIKQREILIRQLPMILPGVSSSRGAFIINLAEYVEELRSQKAVEIYA